MARRKAHRPRSAAEWMVRSVLALAAAVTGYVAIARTVGYTIRAGDPAGAYRAAPSDGRIVALYAQALAGVDATPADRRRADSLARIALQRDPTVVAAVSTLALDTQIDGNVVGARHLFAYAEKLSRRDLRTQIWAIEDAVARGDVKGALRHYDLALRTSREASELLFPILTSAMTEPVVCEALVRTLTPQPLWTQAFIEYAAGQEADARARASLFAALAKAGVPISDAARAASIDGLIKAGLHDDAWRYYASVRRGVDRQRSRDARFTATYSAPSVLDWTAVQSPDISTTLGDTMADVTAGPSAGGPVLRQLQLLPPGTYSLLGHVRYPDPSARMAGYWAVTCLDGRELGRVMLPNDRLGLFRATVSVPLGCSAQYLSLIAQPIDGGRSTSVQIDRVELTPAP